MNRHRLRAHLACTLPAAVLAAALVCAPGAAMAQERSGGFLDNLFNRGQQPEAPQVQPAPPPGGPPQVAQANSGETSARIDRIENALRQLTGTIEQLQHQNQMLQMQLKRMQDDTEYRFQQMGVKGTAAPMAPAGAAPMGPPGAAPPITNGRRSDVFDPTQHPNAPGAPRTLGNPAAIAAPEPGTTAANAPPVGVPGGREVGAPLDLSTLAGNAPVQQPVQATGAAPMAPPPPQSAPMPAPPSNTSATDVRLATLPPSASPKDEYELAYGYVLHKDYPLAEQAFRDFIRKYPNERLLPEAQYWLGESQFQQQRYRDAAETFLAVSTKYEHSGKAPDALLRLGQSLAVLHQKEAACATLAEVARKFPRASAGVKRSVAREQKRAHC